MNRNAAIYVRVSTEEQAKHWGIQAQRSQCAKYCRENRLSVVQTYEDSVSGGTSLRPAFQRMLVDAKQQGYSVIVVAKLDRLARDLYLQIGTIEDLRRGGVEVVSVAEPLGSGDEASNTLVRNMFGSFGQYERDKIKNRLRGGAIEKAKQGKYAGGRPPYGYVQSHKLLCLSEPQAVIVREIFSLRRRRYSLQDIADELNADGSLTAAGMPWKKSAVYRVLRAKDIYQGKYRYASIVAQGVHERIL